MFTIRREEPDDAEAVARVHVRSWQAGYAGIMPDEVLGRLNPAAWAQRRRDLGTADPEHPFTTLLAEADGVLTGFATFGPYRNNQDRGDLDPAYGEILAMYLAPDWWGTGAGRALLAAARAGLAERGWTEYRVWVLADNVRARRFYERAGLSPDGDESTYPVPLHGGRDPVRLREVRYTARLAG
ncbi:MULTISPECIES: GNAT family N-acetyltransferase [Micromonospora]|uniref:GNAT family N-acetyltransferase n=1 Tax=Micromonospora solifontis TaxID=2487138 RepID=A0ABX9WLY4_9ACTN|nr:MULTISPECIES: GNAT family N-acetyltransferase [Micromonospora]NES12781.1 GNAT family N-acetyltransferase [Micromonospora sp. PPF5-17B]NES34968.1 GNAT family N-acetyltransferase [Micromonospora solifontis]NES54706.1 GNAT family N-acetyltransferase [Micromonospora sp. PPF5-6]RNM01528.1 GNAT family N-acetyltransferase [Micromonospora solifontis]